MAFRPALLTTAVALALPFSTAGNAARQIVARTLPPAEATMPVPDPAQTEAVLDRFARARDNLIALREGRRTVSELTPLELQDVIEFERRTRGEVVDSRSPGQQCIDDEVRRAGGRPTQLAWQVIRLKCRD